MTLMWKPGYSTGVPELDEQHREVFDMLNGLEDMISKGICEGPGLDDHIKSLGAHITRHFNDEECCMDRLNCPMAKKNKQEHQQLLEEFSAFTARYGQNKSLAVLSEFHASAESWIHQHVAFLDIHLRSCIKPVKA